jgi:hypothetical protein
MDWCEIFKAGTHTDSRGRAKSFSDADLDRIVSSYDPNSHEAPICIDHNEQAGPVVGGPAYGWVESLKREGSRLFAKFRQVVPEFAEAVSRGLFKKRSISLYPDGTLRHVAWLGAQPPAIKGLAEFKFSAEADASTFFQEIAQESTSSGPTISPKEGERMPTELELKLQADLEAQKAETAKANARAEQAEGKVKTTETEFAEHRKATRRKEVETFIDTQIEAGKILPAWKASGLVEFMTRLDDEAQTFDFSETAKGQTLGQFFRSMLAEFAEHPLFKEMTKGKKDQKHDETDADKGAKLIISKSNYGKKEGK